MSQSEAKKLDALKRSLLSAASQGDMAAAKRIAQELRDHAPGIVVSVFRHNGVYDIDGKDFTLGEAKVHLRQLQKRSKMSIIARGVIGTTEDPFALMSREQGGVIFSLPDNGRDNQ